MSIHDVGFGSYFLDMTQKTQATRRKNKLVFIKKNICAFKDVINKVRRHPTEWEKILANYVFMTRDH